MKLLREAIRLLIEEYSLQKNITLYHRSPVKLNIGDEISTGRSPRSEKIKNSYINNKVEVELERLRPENKPSRMDCAYSTFIPRSRFASRGFLYSVQPQGRIHITNSMIIDELNESFSRYISDALDVYDSYSEAANSVYVEEYLVKEYWKGVDPNKENLKILEILSDSAIVLDVVDEKGKIRSGKIVELLEPIEVNLYSDTKNENTLKSLEDMKNRGLISDWTKQEFKYIVTLTKGAQFSVWVSQPQPSSSDYQSYDKTKFIMASLTDKQTGIVFKLDGDDTDNLEKLVKVVD